jgi:exodeoxyribonuclease VII small subunit
VEEILARLEAEEIDIDDLSREVKRAAELIQLCRRKLEKTEREVGDLVAELQPESGEPQDKKRSLPDQADGAEAVAEDAKDLPF